MCSKLKMYIGRKLVDSLPKSFDVSPVQLKSLIQLGPSRNKNTIEMNLPLNALENQVGIPYINQMLKLEPDDIIKNIHYEKTRSNRVLQFEINKSIFIKDVMESPIILLNERFPMNVVVEYSSPNVAKPFHVGHLRSTIIGNFLSNLHKHLDDKVTRLNYLGDWGTQFGLIKVGVEKLNYTVDKIREKPIERLYESYVYANKLASVDDSIKKLAREEFLKLEKGSPKDMEDWKMFISFTIEELKNTYQRLGVEFDEYNYESMYGAREIESIISLLNNKQIIKTSADGKKVAMVNDREVAVLKSDGGTLYLLRDIAAAIDRYNKHRFDRMYYVVENGQNDHFHALQTILHMLDMPWTDRLRHVKFGRIHGMSTRKGNVVFLKDILDEMREIMASKQIKSPNTKKTAMDTETQDILAVSCVIVNDLKQRRQRDYKFNWEKALQADGDTGIKLQYTHSRLCSLQNNSGVIPAGVCRPELVDEPEVTNIVREIGRFQDILMKTEEQLEACILVVYLFNFCNTISRALKVLRVKNEDPVVASQRLMVFLKAKEVLNKGMKVLGLQPLQEM
ncbi:probable arginine--tRNA ligase, mitochondrial [Agrilus planipennis]|uniref:Probable arginine--tRNA ligase, mitochondrial n=1 Tax=Agrilus planipennis TaxID=224129 RepID=A0A1W4WNC6_AGRPL|nr:probable arginine--tRNA ligase, mitochondrial [Agrilus planipennis]